ncbi:unnamed protein product [Paramecium sonneborni]|uniref:Protein kinase domain-containing protein n=1 Tax=Paramecium sonneborni TaxID=65129 RepID=A0A8S1NS99_9CILI|nr:unnamed protein product [Paramecium sonneborni]
MEKLQSMPNYEIIRIIGSGAFGYVFEAFDQQRRQKVALKRMQKVGKFQSRECEILQQLKQCSYVVKILVQEHIMQDVFYSKSEDNKMIQNIILEFMDQNLEDIIQEHRKKEIYLDCKVLKNYLYQTFKGLDQIHRKHIAHRDLKPENILVKDGKIKLCDFGSAKQLHPVTINTPYIVSRFYRAPELLLGITEYDVSIDIWAMGCIMAELALLEPFFIGKSDGDQFFKILRILGSFSKQDLKYYQKVVPFNGKLFKEFPNYERINLNKKFEHIDDKDLFIDLLSKLLKYIPEERITASQALKHQYFKELLDQ